MNPKKIEVIFEFLVFGIIIGITEDLIAIKLTTDASVTLKMVCIIILIAIPFAIIGEIFADKIDFVKVFEKIFKKKKKY